MPRSYPPYLLAATALLLALPIAAQAPATAVTEPAMQLPPDQAAFNKANAIVDKQGRATALDAFLHQYPKGKRADRARSIQLQLLLDQQPRDERRVHELAKATVDSADKDSRAGKENSIAYSLAEAPPNGIDLKSAEGWARDAVQQSTEQRIASEMKESFAKDKEPAPSATVLHQIFASIQSANLQTLADVYLHEGKLAEATAAVDQAQQLNPAQGANYVTRGQIAHAQHHDDQALDALETAEVYGGMTPPAQDLLVSLYAAQHGGDRSGLDAEIDRRYNALYRPMPTVAHTASTAGRTVLLSLYTGSGCEPCAAADLATDALLRNYTRAEVVALAFDQHIPEPDPLANAATVARAAYDGVHFTPTFRMNGIEGPEVYGRRTDAEKAYRTLSAAVDKQLAIASGATLQLSASLTPAHTVAATANFQVTDADVLQKLLTAKPDAAKSANSKPAASSEHVAAKAPKLVMNFALVQREIRYSGENGIRFHAMVVRDLAKPTADAFPVGHSGTSSASFTFDPAAISAALRKYLADFAQHNDRFGSPHFLSTDTTLPLNDLAVAAWVEDLTSHQVVAAAYAPLTGTQTEQAAR